MSKQLFEITGFQQLQTQLKKLPESVKKREVYKILGQVANPTLAAAKRLAPVSRNPHVRYVGTTKGRRRKRGSVSVSDKIKIEPGNLKASIKKIKAKKSPNVRLDVGARAARSKRAKADGYYAHMIVKKGFSGKNRKGSNYDFFKKAYEQTKGGVTADAEKRVARYIQKQINRLSTA